MATLFEKIIKREIPATIVHEDESCIAIQDIAPQAPVHLLLIPKKPIPSLADVNGTDAQLLAHLMLTAKMLGEQNAPDGSYRVVINCGETAGQTVPHLHIHLLAGRSLAWPPG